MSSNKGPLPDFSALQAAIAPSESEVESSSEPSSDAVSNSEPAADAFPSFSLNTKPVKKPTGTKPEAKSDPAAKASSKQTKAAQPVIAVKPAEPIAKPAAPTVTQAPAKPVAKKQTGIAAEVSGLQDFAAAIAGETKVASSAAPTINLSTESVAVNPIPSAASATTVATVTTTAKETKPAAVAATTAAPKTTSGRSKATAVRGQQLMPIIADIAAGVAFAGAAATLYQGINSGTVLGVISNVAMLIVAGAGMSSLGLISRLLIKLNDQQG